MQTRPARGGFESANSPPPVKPKLWGFPRNKLVAFGRSPGESPEFTVAPSCVWKPGDSGRICAGSLALKNRLTDGGFQLAEGWAAGTNHRAYFVVVNIHLMGIFSAPLTDPCRQADRPFTQGVRDRRAGQGMTIRVKRPMPTSFQIRPQNVAPGKDDDRHRIHAQEEGDRKNTAAKFCFHHVSERPLTACLSICHK